ncbi:TPM domain-containing protein [Mycolicibacterium sp. 624]|uniref:TPM domain-containing protein n=1 Tax=Mycolicibacterium sp. 624 TaxID=3156314 RepID=UPI0033965107
MRRRLRVTRLFSLVLAVLAAALLVPTAPTAWADPPLRLSNYVTDNAGVLDRGQSSAVQAAVEDLYTQRRVRLWVVYVDSFSGQSADTWARNTMRISDFQNEDAILAVATTDRAYALLVPKAAAGSIDVDTLRRNEVEPALRRGDWAGAAVAAATGLNATSSGGSEITWVGMLAILAVIVIAVALLLWWRSWRRRKRRAAEFAAAQRVNPADPAALAALSLDALDDLSRSIVVDVDNAVRTSDNELVLAVEEFGEKDTAPFSAAVAAAKKTLTQAFNVRQILDDAVPETPAERRDLLTRVVVAAAKADRELDAQREAFQELRDLVINAPSRLDSLTQQMVDLTARIEPSRQTLAALGAQFSETALTSVTGNVETASQRLTFADQNITNARTLVSRPAGSQSGLVDSIRAAESALGQARTMLDAIDSASTDINRAVAGLPAAIADIQNGVKQAGELLAQPGTPRTDELRTARDAAAAAVAVAQSSGSADPLGAFTQLTQADADLDRLLATITEERETAERMSRAFDQALFSAQSRVRAVTDFIDTRRGSVGPEARTRLSEAVRQLGAAQSKRTSDLAEAIAHANGAAMLAEQAQTLAHTDVSNAQRAYSNYRGGGGGNSGAILGGIIIGNILSGALGGGLGGSAGGGWSSTTFGGSGGGGFSGGGGRF